MSAEILREAAALMRSRAKAATDGLWTHAGFGEVVSGYSEPDDDDTYSSYYSTSNIANTDEDAAEADDAEHIASWHPAVALAVADWLEHQATTWDHPGFIASAMAPHPALAVATAYLGVDQ